MLREIASPASFAPGRAPWVTFDHMLRAAGVVALIVLAACSGTSGTHVTSPTPIVAQGSWTQNLTFSGELTGHMAAIVPDIGDQRSQCTGGRTHNGGKWTDVFCGTGGTDGGGWGGAAESKNYRGTRG